MTPIYLNKTFLINQGQCYVQKKRSNLKTKMIKRIKLLTEQMLSCHEKERVFY